MTAASLGAVDRLRAALQGAHDWFESQAKAISKGCGSSWDLMQVREQRDRIAAELAALTPAAGGKQLSLIGCAHLIEKNHPEVARVLRQHADELVAAAPPPADAVRALVAKLEQPRTLSMFMGAHDMALALVQERAEIARELAALSAAPAGEETSGTFPRGVLNQLAAAPTPEGRPLTQDEQTAVTFYARNPTAALQDLRRRVVGDSTQQEGGRHG